MDLDFETLIDLEHRLNLAACAVNGLLHPNREHPPNGERSRELQEITRRRLAELRQAIPER